MRQPIFLRGPAVPRAAPPRAADLVPTRLAAGGTGGSGGGGGGGASPKVRFAERPSEFLGDNQMEEGGSRLPPPGKVEVREHSQWTPAFSWLLGPAPSWRVSLPAGWGPCFRRPPHVCGSPRAARRRMLYSWPACTCQWLCAPTRRCSRPEGWGQGRLSSVAATRGQQAPTGRLGPAPALGTSLPPEPGSPPPPLLFCQQILFIKRSGSPASSPLLSSPSPPLPSSPLLSSPLLSDLHLVSYKVSHSAVREGRLWGGTKGKFRRRKGGGGREEVGGARRAGPQASGAAWHISVRMSMRLFRPER